MSGSDANGGGSFYDVLGISEAADADEIKRAYYRLVRQHRPSEQPDLFQRYSDAHRTLSDKRRRGAYDQSRKAGRRVQALQDQAAAALEKDSQKAIMLLKAAVVAAPDLPRPRQMLAQVLTRVADYEGADKQFQWLIAESPRDEALRVKYARCLHLAGREGEAMTQLAEALRINPLFYDALLALAKVHESVGRIDEAAEALERAIRGDGVENVADVDPLMRLYALYDQNGRGEEADAARERLRAVLAAASDPQRRERAVQRISRRAKELYQGGGDASAASLAAVAAEAAGEEMNEEARDEALAVAQFTALTQQARRAVADPLVEGALRDCVRLKYLERAGTDDSRRARMDDLLARLQTEITDDPKRLGAAVEYLRREYPDIAADQSAFLQELVARVVRRLQILGPEGKYEGRRAAADGSSAMPSSMPSTPAAPTAPASPVVPVAPVPEAAPTAPSAPPPRKGGLLGWLRGGK